MFTRPGRDPDLAKEELLARLQADRKVLLDAIEGVPEDALTEPNTIDDQWRVIDVLAMITAWDGETVRRIDIARGERRPDLHDVYDDAYWEAWLKEQVELKRVLGVRGTKVDFAGTWIRLQARIEDLEPMEYRRWLELDPRILTERRDLDLAEKLRAWRTEWQASRSWWEKLQQGWLQRIERLNTRLAERNRQRLREEAQRAEEERDQSDQSS